MVGNLFDQLAHLKAQMGTFARNTIFGNVGKLTAALLGVAESTITRTRQKLFDTREEAKAKSVTRKSRNAAALALLSDEEKQIILDHISRCHQEESNFTISSLHEDLQNLFDYPYSPSTLYRQLKALRFSYKIKSHNPLSSVREDIIRWRAKYLHLIDELRMSGAFICYYDETWLYHGMTTIRGWNRTDTNPYLIAHLGDLRNPRPGFAAASDKGQRAIVLAVTTESEILPGSIDVVITKRPDSEIVVDYHQYMNAEMYKEYMAKVLPLIAAAAPVGRKAVLVIDNAAVHNSVVEKIPTKSSTKKDLLDFLGKNGVAINVVANKDELLEEVNNFIETRGGRKAFQRYVVDELAMSLGVQIVRLPPYHCQFSPIELIWNQLKTHLRSIGKSTDRLETVRERAIQFLKNKSESDIAWTYEHVIEIENGIKLLLEEDVESDCDDDV
ncbi:unnamed protein product [Caenorhabditis nigoni]